MAGMVDLNASLSGSSSATSGSQVSANTGGVFYKSKKDNPPWLIIAIVGVAAGLIALYLMRRS